MILTLYLVVFNLLVARDKELTPTLFTLFL